jgi:hypothetical protein
MAFHARSSLYALKRAHMLAIFLGCARVTQFKTFLWCVKLVALFWIRLFCIRSEAFICPSL